MEATSDTKAWAPQQSIQPSELYGFINDDTRKVLEDPDALAAWNEPYVPNSEEEKQMVRKIDRHMMPMLWVMYVLNYIDRTNIGNARVGGLEEDLNLDSNKYSVALLIFFVGYLLFEVPSNMILSKSRPSIFLPAIMFVWGCMTIAFVGIKSFGSLVALRFILGVIESGFFPGVLFLLSSWYKREELSKRFAIFYSASIISGAFGGILAAVIIDGMDGVGGVRGWRWLFVVEGLATVVVSVGAVFVLPDYPRSTGWLTPREKALALKRLAIESRAQSQGREIGHKEGLMLAVKDWKTWGMTVGYMAIAGAGTISYFIPAIVQQLGYRGRDAQWYSAPPYACALFFSLLVNFHADYRREKAFHAAIPIAISGILCIAQATHLANIPAYVLLCFVAAGIWTTLPCYLSYATSVLGEPPAKRAVAIAIVNSLGNFASVYGAFLWPKETAPEYRMGWSVSAAFCFLGTIMVLVIRFTQGPLRVVDEKTVLQERAEEHLDESSIGDQDAHNVNKMNKHGFSTQYDTTDVKP